MYIGLLRDFGVAEAEAVVHGVKEGRALCGFTNNIPGDWPVGHRSAPYFRAEDITCVICKRMAREMDPLDLR